MRDDFKTESRLQKCRRFFTDCELLFNNSIEGDYNMVTLAEVEKLASGDGSGRIQR